MKTAIRRATLWLPRRPRPAILMYHRIAQASFDPWGLAVEERHLAAQLEWVARHRSVLTLSEFARRHSKGSLPADAIAITFDDGYRSSLRSAVPLLEQFGLPATIFLPAGQIERGSEFWWDELASIVLNFEGETLRMSEADVRVPAREQRDRNWRPDAPPDTPRQVLFYALWSKLRSAEQAVIEQAMEQLRSQAGKRGTAEDPPVAADELRSITSDAVEFGSHAMTHASLPALPADEQAREIAESRARCAELTGWTPTTFAYPYGDFDERSRRLVESAGFRCACSAEHAFVSSGADVFALPRLRVRNGGAASLRDMLRTG